MIWTSLGWCGCESSDPFTNLPAFDPIVGTVAWPVLGSELQGVIHALVASPPETETLDNKKPNRPSEVGVA